MIELAIDGPLAVATLCRGPVNAINDEWIDRLDSVLDEIAAQPAVAVLWLRSRARVFCAGADLALMRSRFASEAGRGQMIALTRRMQQVFERVERLGAVSLAEIGGHAMGGGFELALACDLRVVSEAAQVGLPEARLGLLPAAGGTQRLTRLAGDALARRLILGAETVAGVEAVSLGLAQWSAPAAQLEARAGDIVARIAALPPDALAGCKRAIAAALETCHRAFDLELAESARLLASPSTQQRVARFLEK